MISNLSLEFVCEKTASLPCAPDLLPQIISLMNQPEVVSSSLIALVSRDPGSTAAILRLANSAYFRGTKCNSLDEAFLRLGSNEIYKLMARGLVGRWMSAPVEGYGWAPGDLCTHSFIVAIAAETLARKRGGMDPKDVYTAGLLHDIGKLGMAHACGQHFDKVRKLQEESGRSWRVLEREVFGFDHTEVAAALLRKWNFPIPLVQVVAYYPKPRSVQGPNRPLIVLVHAAKKIACDVRFGVGDDGFQKELDEDLLAEEGYVPDFVDPLLPEIIAEAENSIGGEGAVSASAG
ncbi:MAG: HDOD domain-containing protein [Verrucomicrobiae bacterium]